MNPIQSHQLPNVSDDAGLPSIARLAARIATAISFAGFLLFSAGCGAGPEIKPSVDLASAALQLKAAAQLAARDALAAELVVDFRARRDSFVVRMNKFDDICERVSSSGELEADGEVSAREHFQAVREARGVFEQAAMGLWTGFDMDGKLTSESAERFDNALDDLDVRLGQFAKSAFAILERKDPKPAKAFAAAAEMQDHSFQATWEALAYMLLIDKTEKDDCSRSMIAFEKAEADFSLRVESIGHRAKAAKTAFQAMPARKAAFNMAMATMFAKYEEDGRPDSRSVELYLMASDEFALSLSHILEACVAEIKSDS